MNEKTITGVDYLTKKEIRVIANSSYNKHKPYTYEVWEKCRDLVRRGLITEVNVWVPNVTIHNGKGGW